MTCGGHGWSEVEVDKKNRDESRTEPERYSGGETQIKESFQTVIYSKDPNGQFLVGVKAHNISENRR